ncbi:metallophosphoesterase [Loigolactobacillus binensis]|uniref:Metallophosphoesterase n=1 Tax=Loigolactobacillus binensis TaxID=2559922 RepID=A0ABW3E983_9LACO|nr:metallophosphoesterase [Loigolactobacillus binensis]
MRRTAIIITILITSLLLLLGLLTKTQADDRTTYLTQSTHPSFWVLSDPHFIAPSLHDKRTAFKQIIKTAAGKDLTDQPVALHALVQTALKKHPTAVIITGDVTFNGELASAKSLARRLRPLQKAGIHLLIIPGNHDIYDGWARKFTGDHQATTTQISPSAWRQIFADGYRNACAVDNDSLSYAVNLNKRYRLLLLDDNTYPTSTSTVAPNTAGKLKQSTLLWIEGQLQSAKAAGQQTLVFTHHNLYAHSMMKQGWVLDNAPALRRILNRYHVPLLFSGHIHAQDIMADPTKKCATTEIVSGSFSMTPASYGVVTLTPHKLHYQIHQLRLTPYLTAKQRHQPSLVHYQQHLKKLFQQMNLNMVGHHIRANHALTKHQANTEINFLLNADWRFETGNDYTTPRQLAKLKQTAGYKLAAHDSHLSGPLGTLNGDHNLPDHHLTLRY